ncbi:MAG: PEP-CTERM sorting domain-containing protein [Candidatus Solibacter sp.]
MSRINIFAATALALSIGTLAQASIIGNGPSNQSGASDLNAFIEGDDFVVAGPSAQVTQIKFWALQFTPADFSGTMDWAFYSDASGFPGSSISSGNAAATGVATGFNVFGLDEFAYTLNINATLGTGTYWLALHNGPSNTIPNGSFYWSWSDGNSGNSASLDVLSGPPWTGNSAELAFELTVADAPEPMSMSLVGGGLLAAWLLRRKKALGA